MAYAGTQAQAGRGTSVSIGANLSITGTTTVASTSVTAVSSTAGIVVGMPISGTGISVGATVASIGTGTLTLSVAATAAGTAVALTVDASTEIGELDNFPLDRPEWKTADATNFNSGSDAEKIVTIRDSSTFTLTGNRVDSDAGQQAVEAAYQAGTLQSFTATLPIPPGKTTAATVTFKAFVLSNNFAVKTEDIIKFSVKLQISGPGTVTAAS